MYLKFKQKIVEHVKKAKKKTFLLHFSFRNFSLDWCNLIWFHMQKQCGIVPNFGLCCAMGLALAVEGLLSACYHLCPHSMTSQFGKFLMSDQLMTHSCIIYKCWWFFFFFHLHRLYIHVHHMHTVLPETVLCEEISSGARIEQRLRISGGRCLPRVLEIPPRDDLLQQLPNHRPFADLHACLDRDLRVWPHEIFISQSG